MGAAFGGVKFVSAAACYNVLAVFNVIIQHIRKPEKFGLSVRNGNHNNAYGFLQIGVFKQSIQHFLRIEILFDFYNGANGVTMGQDGSMQVFNSSTNIQTMAPGADGTIWLFRQTNSYADDGTEGTSISELIQLDAHGTLLRTITPTEEEDKSEAKRS